MGEPERLSLKRYGIWESWFTPLKRYAKTHYLKITYPSGVEIFIRYVSGDFLDVYVLGSWKRLGREFPFREVENALVEGDVEFVKKEEVDLDG